MSRKHLDGRFLRSTMLTGVAAVAAMPAVAQDEEDDTIIVTGTRIQRADLAAPSPVTTVDSAQLQLTNTVNSEQFLNTLPQVIPSLDSSSNNPGNGTATVNLRGLGTNRTLVLVDGTRFVASGSGSTVDLNNIPTALVERVEVVTGGASAIYGSDAVAGVVNFILKDDFEGVQLDASHELSASGWDANTTNVNLTVGGNFGDGRGNAVITMGYTNREALFQGDRAFSSDTLVDTGTGFTTGGSLNVQPGLFIAPAFNQFDWTTIGFANANPAVCTAGDGAPCFPGAIVNADGTVSPFRDGVVNDRYNYAPANYLQLPQERYNISGFATYEINDWAELYARGIFASNTVDSQLAPTPAFLGGVVVDANNPFLPAQLATLLANDPNANLGDTNGDGFDEYTFGFTRRYEELGTRNSLRTSSSFQGLFGVRGDINDTWSYDTFFNYSQTDVSQIQTGNISASAVIEAIRTQDGTTCVSGNASCVPINVFGAGNISPDAAAYVSRTGAIINKVEQLQWVGTISGSVDEIKSPWADNGLAVVFGLEYRENFADVIPDSVLGPDVRGFNASLPVGGRYDVYEAFTEMNMPLVSGKPLFESLSLNGAYRYSDYSIAAVGGTHTYALGVDWEMIPGLRLRGQFQRAVRAPNIGELFAASTNGFPSASDPCAGGGNGAFSSATLVSTCIATGAPASAYSGGTTSLVQPNGQIEALFGGNPNLFEETANTWTGGMVWQPTFADGLTLQVDYYTIKVQDAIATLPLQNVLDDCHLSGVASACAVIVRNPAGLIVAPARPNLGSLNIATLEVEGIDFQLGYQIDADQMGLPASAGSFTAQYYGSYTMTNGFQSSATQPFVDCTGIFAGSCGEPTPQYKHTAQVGWLYGPLTTSVRWRYIGGTENDFGAAGFFVGELDSANYVDVTLQYAASDNIDLTLGVQNITGKDAPLLGSTINEQANTWPATYETLGRQLFFGTSIRF